MLDLLPQHMVNGLGPRALSAPPGRFVSSAAFWGLTGWGFLLSFVFALSTAQAADHLLLIGGLGGEEKYSKEFHEALTTIRSLLAEKHGRPAANARLLTDSEATTRGVNAVSTLENVAREFERLRADMRTSDTLLLILVGHGQSDFQEPKFNLPGRDLTASALGRMLDALPAQDQRLVLAFPCSGHFSQILAHPLRTILASTDGPRQIHHCVMPRYLIEALKTDAADTDHDGAVSFYELFGFLSQEVEGHFVGGDMLQTENPSLEYNGDREVTTLAEGMDAGDGENAKRIRFTPAPGKPGI